MAGQTTRIRALSHVLGMGVHVRRRGSRQRCRLSLRGCKRWQDVMRPSLVRCKLGITLLRWCPTAAALPTKVLLLKLCCQTGRPVAAPNTSISHTETMLIVRLAR